MIKNVEELREELEANSVADCHVLNDGEICVVKCWPDDHVAAQVPKACDRRKYRSIKPCVGAAQNTDRPAHVRSECAGHTIDRAVGSDNVYRVTALRLHDGRKLPAFNESIAVKWQFIDCADYESMPNIKV